MEPTIPDAPFALRALLKRLPAAGLLVTQHVFDPQPDAWYAGDQGPYRTAEEAIEGGIAWLRGLYEDARQARDAAEAELARRSEQGTN